MSMLSKSVAMVAVSAGLTLTAASASATTFLSDSLGTLIINPVTDTGSLSSATTLIYKKTTKPTASSLSYAFSVGGSGVVKGIPQATSDNTQIDYTFKIATPADLLYGQVINTVQGNKVALGGGTLQLWDLTTNSFLTPVVSLALVGNINSATSAKYSLNLTDTDDLYALRVIGAVPIEPTAKSTINVQYSSSVFATGVPEPTAWTLLLAGFGGVGAALRRREGRTASAA